MSMRFEKFSSNVLEEFNSDRESASKLAQKRRLKEADKIRISVVKKVLNYDLFPPEIRESYLRTPYAINKFAKQFKISREDLWQYVSCEVLVYPERVQRYLDKHPTARIMDVIKYEEWIYGRK